MFTRIVEVKAKSGKAKELAKTTAGQLYAMRSSGYMGRMPVVIPAADSSQMRAATASFSAPY